MVRTMMEVTDPSILAQLNGGSDTSLSVKNNNPGNMRAAGGEFQQFDTPKAGLDAMQKDLLAKISGNSPVMKAHYGEGYQPTLRNVISTWAPPTENDTNGYINFIAQHSGLDPDQPLKPEDVAKIMQPMVHMEGGQKASQYFSKLMDGLPAGKQYASADNIKTDAQVDAPKEVTDPALLAQLESSDSNKQPIDKFDTISDQALQGATFGLGNRAQAGLAALVASGINDKSLSENYKAAREIGSQRLKSEMSDSPVTSVLANLGGAIATGGIAGDTQAGSALANYLRSGSTLARAGKGIVSGALSGAAYGAGTADYGKAAESALQSLPYGAALGGAAPIVGEAANKIGNALVNSGVAKQAAQKAKFIQDLITPKETPTVRADQFSRSTEQGILRNRVVEPTAQEKAIIATISQLPVSKSKSLLANHNIIEDAKNTEAQALISRLKANDVPIDRKVVASTLNDTVDQLKKNPYISGTGENAANSVMEGAVVALKNNPSTASGLLQARKDFDAWVKSQKGSGVFDPARDSAVTTSVQQIRQTINDLVAKSVPAAPVRESLQKQSNLYRAMDNIQTKGGYEGKNAVARLANKAAGLIPVKNAVAKGALALGATGAAASSPILAGSALAIYGAQKALRAPATRIGLGKLTKSGGDILKLESPIPVLSNLRLKQANP